MQLLAYSIQVVGEKAAVDIKGHRGTGVTEHPLNSFDVGRLQASATFERSEAALVKEPPADDKEHAEDQEPDVPGKRRAEIVAHVMNSEYLVVDHSLNDVKDAPPGKHQSKVKTPVRREVTLLPGNNGGDRTG